MASSLLERFSASLLIYVVAIVSCGALLWLWAIRWLRRASEVRRQNILKRKNFEAVVTTSPHDDPVALAKRRGIESVEAQFSVVRRAVGPLLAFLVLSMIAVPFLSEVPASLLSLIIGVVTVVLGIAARPVVENAISGLVLAVSKTINIGDTVMVETQYGTVEDISLTHTTIKLWDWRRYVVPNGLLSQIRFVNYSLFDRHQWAYIEFWVSYEADLDEVERIAVEVAKASPFFDGSEEPKFWYMETARDAICCWLAAWAETPSSAWSLKHDMRGRLVRDFQKHGVRTHLNRQELSGTVARGGSRHPREGEPLDR